MEAYLKNKKINPDFDLGRMPPSALELEDAVIGAMLLESECVPVIASILSAQSFYKEAHVLIFKAILSLFKNSYPIDILTVTQELKKTGELDIVGGGYYIVTLTNRVASAGNAEYHARIIQQKFIQRELIRVSTKTINDAYEDSFDVFDLLDNAEKNLFLISQSTIKKEPKTASELINKTIKEIELIAMRKDGLSGIPSGLVDLDRKTGGWQKSDLIIIAARPAMGKTALAVTLAKNAAINFNIPTALFSLEMSENQLMKRIISAQSQLNSYLLKSPKNLTDSDWRQIQEAATPISKAPLFIDDTPALSIFELRAKARRLKEKSGIELIIIDYLQLMTTGIDDNKRNREQEISYISRSLKALAKDLNVPIIALSQLNRAVETRGGDKKPQLSDLRESGAIEQDADMVIFPHRPEYYGITEDAHGNSTVGLAELIIAKHREGLTDTVITKYIAHLTTFSDVQESYTSGITESKKESDPF